MNVKLQKKINPQTYTGKLELVKSEPVCLKLSYRQQDVYC